MLENHAWGEHLIQNWCMCSNTCTLLAGTPTKWWGLWYVKSFCVFSSQCKIRMPKQRSTYGWTTWSRGVGTDTSSAKQQPTRGISTSSRGSGSDSSSARGSQCTPLTRNDISVLIQEVVQLLTTRSSLRHSKQSSMENTSDQPTPASNTAPSTHFANNTLTTNDIPGLVQQVCQALSEDHHTLQSIPWPWPLDQSPTMSFLSHILLVNVEL